MSQNEQTLLNVAGMTCNHCVRHVEAALKKIEGVGAIEISLAEGKVRVEHDPAKAPVARMIEALGDEGYEAHVRA